MLMKAAIIGCGRIGCGFNDDPQVKYIRTHAGAYKAIDKIELVALTDIIEHKAKSYSKKFNVPNYYANYKTMLEQEHPDIVSICTQPEQHLEIIKTATEAGVKAILCEKPFTTNSLSATTAIFNCGENTILSIGYHRRFDPLQYKIANFIKTKIGKIQHVSCYYMAGALNTCSHLLDLLKIYFGKINTTYGKYSKFPSNNKLDPNLDMHINIANNIEVDIKACDGSFLIFEINIIGSKGRLRISPCGFDVDILYDHVIQSTRFNYTELQPKPFPINTKSSELLVLGIKNIVEAIDKKQNLLSTSQNGLDILRTIEAAKATADMEKLCQN